jgi:hypothetical protein
MVARSASRGGARGERVPLRNIFDGREVIDRNHYLGYENW